MNQDSITGFPWSLLGIEPTDDPARVKAAYAIALRGMEPDRDPDAFQALRAARDRALAHGAAGSIPAAGSDCRTHPSPPVAVTDQKQALRTGANEANTPEASDGTAAEVLAQLGTFLNGPWTRSDAHSWTHFLQRLPILEPQLMALVERAIAEQVDAWLDEENLPSGGILLVVSDRFGWECSDGHLPELLGQLRAARLRAAIAGLRG